MENIIIHNFPPKTLARFRLIELLAYWEGRVNAQDLKHYCDLSRQQSSSELNNYKEFAPQNLMYNASQKAHLPSESFTPLFITTAADEYLYWFHHGHVSAPSTHHLSESLSIPSRKISPFVMRGIVTAMRQQKRLEVDYVSLNNPNHEGRIISPHSFVNTGLRWHLRAWCEKSGDYRDFVLSRFRGTPELMEKATHTAIEDTAWNTPVIIKLAPDTRLSPAKRAVLENDYQMQNGQLHITTKGCLVQYLLRELQVSIKVIDGTPEAQQLICVNPQDIKPWLFDA